MSKQIRHLKLTSGISYTSGKDVKKIEMRTDGNGISGYYDMIYVYLEDGIAAFPAHNVEGWTFDYE